MMFKLFGILTDLLKVSSSKLFSMFVFVVAVIGATLSTTNNAEASKQTDQIGSSGVNDVCIFDIGGQQGDAFLQFQDFKLAALEWGVRLNLKVYTDERIAAEDFKAGVCDAVSMTGFRVRNFNKFSGTLEAIGAISNEQSMKTVIGYLSSGNPKINAMLKSNDYELAGIMPGGEIYFFTNDRSIDTVEEIAGKKIGVLDYDPTQSILTQGVGASPVTVSIANFGSVFNNGAVDILPSPSLAYEALELYKGLGEDGAVIKFPLAYLTNQFLIRSSAFPAEFGNQSRKYFYQNFDNYMKIVSKGTESIPSKYWHEISDADKDKYVEMLRQSRITLRDSGYYDAKMLSFLSKIRCKLTPSLSECTATDRE